MLYRETRGKNKDCWVMTRPSDAKSLKYSTDLLLIAGRERGCGLRAGAQEPDEDAKVIVRSNGTVGYVGKDIAYHLWKFGLLGRDFGYRKFFRYPNDHVVWISANTARRIIRTLAASAEIYNVIDARQREPQKTVMRRCGCWATQTRPSTTRTSLTKWLRSRRAAPWNSATR